jgi:integrase
MKSRDQILSEYLEVVSETRSPKTHKTYAQALKTFTAVVGDDPLTTETYIKFLRRTKDINPSTQAIYRSAIMGLYLYASQYTKIDVAALTQAKRRYAQRKGYRLPTFDREAIEKIILYCEALQSGLINLRDRAFVLTLADTGLRISEVCALRRGDIDWNEGRTVIIGKGDKQAVVRFSDRALNALKEYLAARSSLDGATGKPLASLPLFARHDKGAGKKIKPVKSGGMWFAIKERMKEAGISPDQIRIHDFRHYFVTVFLLGSGNLKATQEAARHEDSKTTSRYAHLADNEVDRLYDQVINKRAM